ncbi:MAG: pyridoxamine 5'-phosphate oxidase family protein [Pseudolysinimonas sp.]
MSEPTVEILSDEECWRLLAAERVGRIAVDSGNGPRIFPVNHVVYDRIISFRTGPGEKVMESWSHPNVAFEVDGRDGTKFWSVVVEGTSEIRAENDPGLADALRDLVSQHPTPKHMVISIRADRISGRRFPGVRAAQLWNV